MDKYTWVDVGSSYLPSEIVAALLYAQLQHIDAINSLRMAIWKQYESSLQCLTGSGCISLPVIPDGCIHNGHLFYLLTRTHAEQVNLLAALKAE